MRRILRYLQGSVKHVIISSTIPTTEGGSNLNNVFRKLQRNLRASDRDSIVVIQGGINDIYHGHSVEEILFSMGRTLRYLQGRVKHVIISSTIPTTKSRTKWGHEILEGGSRMRPRRICQPDTRNDG